MRSRIPWRQRFLRDLLYDTLHAYPHLSRRLGYRLGGGPERLFCQLRSWIIGVNACLSAARLSARRAKTVGWLLAPLTLGGSVLAAKAWTRIFERLDRMEQQEALRNLLRHMEPGRVDTGSARKLRGWVAVGHVFLRHRHGHRWTRARRKRARARSRQAMDWLQQQARSHCVPLEFIEIELGDVALDLGRERSCLARSQQIDRAVWLAGRDTHLADLWVDERCIVVHAASDLADESWARAALFGIGIVGAGGEANDAIEYAVVFEDDGPAVHAHELLHLFGAEDLYSRYPVEHEFRRTFMQRAIMFSTVGSTRDRQISGTTAQLVGWR